MSRGDTEQSRRSRRERTDEEREHAKGLAAKALDLACSRAKVNHGDLGSLLAVNAKRAAKLRSADDSREGTRAIDVVPTLADAILLDEDVFDELLAEVLVARLSVHGPRQTKTLEQLAMAALNADAEVQRVTTGALADDGKITGPEAPAILEAQAKQRTAHDEFSAGLKRRCAK